MNLHERIRLWREDAAVLRRRGARRAAELLERVAAELDADLREAAEAPEMVDLGRAAALSGYTRGHLRRMIASGALPNHGTPASPVLRVSDLPRKPARPTREDSAEPLTGRALVLSVLARGSRAP